MKTLARLFLLFTVTTTLELVILFKIADLTSWWVTAGSIVATGLFGAWLSKREGSRALRQIREALSTGGEPASAILDGALVLLAGALLITPGVLTDLAGIALLLPPVRRRMRDLLARKVREAIHRRIGSGNVLVFSSPGFEHSGYEVIDAEELRKH